MVQSIESCPENSLTSQQRHFISQNLSCDRYNLSQNQLVCDTFCNKSISARPLGNTTLAGSNYIRIRLVDVNVNINNLLLGFPVAPEIVYSL